MRSKSKSYHPAEIPDIAIFPNADEVAHVNKLVRKSNVKHFHIDPVPPDVLQCRMKHLGILT